MTITHRLTLKTQKSADVTQARVRALVLLAGDRLRRTLSQGNGQVSGVGVGGQRGGDGRRATGDCCALGGPGSPSG